MTAQSPAPRTIIGYLYVENLTSLEIQPRRAALVGWARAQRLRLAEIHLDHTLDRPALATLVTEARHRGRPTTL